MSLLLHACLVSVTTRSLFDHHHPTLTLDMSDLDADLYGGEPHFSFCILLAFDEER